MRNSFTSRLLNVKTSLIGSAVLISAWGCIEERAVQRDSSRELADQEPDPGSGSRDMTSELPDSRPLELDMVTSTLDADTTELDAGVSASDDGLTELDMVPSELDLAIDLAVVDLDMELPEPDQSLSEIDRDNDGVSEVQGDCDDDDPLSFPGNTTPSSWRDYNCDGRVDYVGTIRVIVDNSLKSLCVNNTTIAGVCVEESACPVEGMPINSWDDRVSETYQVVLREGENVISIHGTDLSGVASGMAAWVRVGGRVLPSRAVAPNELDDTAWRYDPSPDTEGKLGWCDPYFDDALWSPAVRAGELFDSVWLSSPKDLYGPSVEWVWDQTPSNLNDAYFRLKVNMPNLGDTAPIPAEERCVLTAEPEPLMGANHMRDPSILNAHDQVWSAVSAHCCGFREGASELFTGRAPQFSALNATHARFTDAAWWSEQPQLAASGRSVAVIWSDSRVNRSRDQVYAQVWTDTGSPLLADLRVSTEENAKNPTITNLPSGGYLAMWQRGYGNNNAAYDLAWALLDEDGGITRSASTLISGAGASQRPQVIAWPHPEADALAVWEGGVEGIGGERGRRGVWAQLFTLSGALIGEPQLLDDPSDLPTPLIDEGTWARNLSLARSGDEVVVVWEADYTGDQEVYSRSLQQALTLGPLRNLSEDRHASVHPTIKAINDGFLVLWSDDRSGDPQLTLLTLDATGAPHGSTKMISTPALRAFKADLIEVSPGVYGVMFEAELAADPQHSAQRRRIYTAEVTCAP